MVKKQGSQNSNHLQFTKVLGETVKNMCLAAKLAVAQKVGIVLHLGEDGDRHQGGVSEPPVNYHYERHV